MSTLLLLRHGEVPGISPPKFRGRQELELTDRGRDEARRTAERVGRLAAGCGDLRQPAPPHGCDRGGGRPALRPFAAGLPDFDDLDYGTWQGLTHDEAKHRWPDQWALWTTAPESVTFPKGENLADLSARVWRGLQRVLQANRARRDRRRRRPRQHQPGAADAASRNAHALLPGAGAGPVLSQRHCFAGPGAQIRLMNSTDHLRGL